MNRKCINNPDNFCYVCGCLTFKSQAEPITPLVQTAYFHYFDCKIADQDKAWTPNIICTSCRTALTKWLRNEPNRHMTFGVPMVWREQKDHTTDCYFCLTNITRLGPKPKDKMVYPNLPSAIRPVSHCSMLPIPTPPKFYCTQTDQEQAPEVPIGLRDPEYQQPGPSTHELQFSQPDLNDLARSLDLSKDKSELLASRMKEKFCLAPGTRISDFRDRHSKFSKFFSTLEKLVYCNDVTSLMKSMNLPQDPKCWRLFIDGSQSSLKAVLLHNGNTLPSIPLAYANDMKETYFNLQSLLKQIHYQDFEWAICADLKVVAILLGLQLGYTKYCCFLCEWDSRARAEHFLKKNWPPREALTPGLKNVNNFPLVAPDKIILPPLHIKLGLMKNFVKALNKEGLAFIYLKGKFPKLTDAKIKEGIFNGPQIRYLLNDPYFDEQLNDIELKAWKSFRTLTKNFLGNVKSQNYESEVKNLIDSYKMMGCNMSLKMHFLHSHLNFFPENLGDVSDEHGERFHQQIMLMERRYKGKIGPNMLGDYCWTLIVDNPNAVHHREAK